jgi:hypothetical protein
MCAYGNNRRFSSFQKTNGLINKNLGIRKFSTSQKLWSNINTTILYEKNIDDLNINKKSSKGQTLFLKNIFLSFIEQF